MRWVPLSLAPVLAGLGALIMPRHDRMRAPPPAPAVKIADVTADPEPRGPQARPRLECPGVVLARESVDVAAKLDGRLASVQVRLGDRVRRGDVLATLDRRSLRGDHAMARAAAKAAQAEVDRAVLELSQARERLGRLAPLTEGIPAISGDEMERARYQEKISAARVDATRADLLERRARVRQAHVTVAEAEVRAPFDGTITGRYADPGAMVGRGTPILRLISDADLLVRFAIPEQAAQSIRPGQRMAVRIPEFAATLPALVEKIAPEVDAAARMIIAEARLELPPRWQGQILSGRAARVTVP